MLFISRSHVFTISTIPCCWAVSVTLNYLVLQKNSGTVSHVVQLAEIKDQGLVASVMGGNLQHHHFLLSVLIE